MPFDHYRDVWPYICISRSRWLQPESYLDPKQCDVVYNKDELKCSWPATFIVQTKDQYGQLVHVPNLKVTIIIVYLFLVYL